MKHQGTFRSFTQAGRLLIRAEVAKLDPCMGVWVCGGMGVWGYGGVWMADIGLQVSDFLSAIGYQPSAIGHLLS